MVVQIELHIGVHRPGNGKAVAHLHVTKGGEEHGADAYQIDERRHHVAVFGDLAVDGHRGDDHHDQHPVHKHISEAEFAFQFLLIPEWAMDS